MRARNKMVLGAVATASLLAAGLVAVTVADEPQAIAKSPAVTAPLPEVQVIEAITRTLPETAMFTGRLAAVEHVGVKPRVGGYIEAVRFREGGMVKRGQVLFELDDQPFRAAVARARAQLLQAEERRTLAERKATRAQTLRREDVISQAELESASADQADSAAAVEAARAMLRLATIDLADTRVRAPIDGRVGEALVTKGNLIGGAGSGGTLLTTIVSVDPLHVELDVDETTYRRLSSAGPGTPVHVQLADESGPGREAKLDFLSNQIDPTTGTARVRAVLPNADGALTPGLFARVRIETGAPRPVVLIRDEAVGTSAQGRHVLVVRPDGGVEPRPVELGESVDGLRAVSGVNAGELVILKGMARPGMTVKPVKAAQPGGVP